MIWKMVQLLGMMLLLAGVILEMQTCKDVYFIVITIGSLIFALGTKFVHYREAEKTKTVPRGTKTIEGKINVGL